MLNLTRLEQCSRHCKLMLSIATCLIIYIASNVAALATLWVFISLAVGMLFYFGNRQVQRISNDQPYKTSLRFIMNLLPIVAIFGLFYTLPNNLRWIFIVQCIGFMLLGVLMLSIYTQRQPRY